jgi:hypothetical protein
VQQVSFHGWESYQLKNEFVQLNVTQQLGGRIIGYKLGDHSFLWSNPLLQGKIPPPTHLAPDGSWLNWGGDKLWPAPQGWDSAAQWPGPPDPVLDGSPQEAKIIRGDGDSLAIELTSPADLRTGIQFRRTIRTFAGTSRVGIAASMTNISDHLISWGIWSVTQLDAGNPDGNGWNPNWNTYMPVNPFSHFPRGYQVLYGTDSNPEIQPQAVPAPLRLQYMWTVGKVGLDSKGGWLANVDGSSGFVFVQKFTFDPNAVYPDGSSVEVWTNGVGTIRAWGRTVRLSTDPSDNPYIVESELLGPQVRLKPGEQSSFIYDWYSANIGGDFPIRSCNDYGCACGPLSARRVGTQIHIDGRFGVFYQGSVKIEFFGSGEKPVGVQKIFATVSPLQPVVLDSVSVKAPAGTASIRVVLFDSKEKRIGTLAEAAISQE